MDLIRTKGAYKNLFSDNDAVVQSRTVRDILRHYNIGAHYSEPHHQHQNPAEHRIQDVNRTINAMMDRTNTPPKYGLLCALFVAYLFNHVSTGVADNKTPIELAFNQIGDISALLLFRWWEPVYYKSYGVEFPSTSGERRGRWCGVAENIGDTLTF